MIMQGEVRGDRWCGGERSSSGTDRGVDVLATLICSTTYRPLSQVGTRRKRCPGQFGQDGMGSIPATPSTKHASCFPPSSLPASIQISIKLVVCLLYHISNNHDPRLYIQVE
jgi:hypothetical protein